MIFGGVIKTYAGGDEQVTGRTNANTPCAANTALPEIAKLTAGPRVAHLFGGKTSAPRSLRAGISDPMPAIALGFLALAIALMAGCASLPDQPGSKPYPHPVLVDDSGGEIMPPMWED